MTLLELIERNELIYYSSPVEVFKGLTGEEVFRYVYYHFFSFGDAMLIFNKTRTTHPVPLECFDFERANRNIFYEPYTKAAIARDFKADLIVSLHIDCSTEDIYNFKHSRSCPLLDEYDMMCFDRILEMINL